MIRLLAVSVLVAVLALATLATALFRSGGDDRAVGTASAGPTTPADAGTGEPLAAPKGEPVLRIKGVERGNVSPTQTVLDFATLDRAATEELTIVEPFVKRRMTFTAIPMRDLLHRAGVDPSARSLYMHALDDYHVDLPIAGLADAGYVATRVDGKKIPIAMGGPVRLLFSGNGKLARDTDNWIWSFDSARVER